MLFRKLPFADARLDSVYGAGYLFRDHRHHWLALKRSVGPISQAETEELRSFR